MTQRALVTGACGYLGSALLRRLAGLHRGGQDTAARPLRALDNLDHGRIQDLADLPAGSDVEFVEADVLDRASLRATLRGVDHVVHLAALVTSPLGFGDTASLMQVNHWGTEAVVEACLSAGVGRLVYASSAAVYGPGGPHSESDPCRPLGPYAQSKLNAERAVAAAADRGLEPVILRLGTMGGWAPGIRFDAVVNRFALLAALGRSLVVHGDGRQRRPFVHVADACSTIEMALDGELPLDGTPINVAAANPSILEIAAACQKVRPELEIRYTDQEVPQHFSLELDAGLLRSTGWSPAADLDATIRDVVHHLGFRSFGGRWID